MSNAATINNLAGMVFLITFSTSTLLISNLVLRQQLTVFKRKRPRPALRDRDRLFWSLISRVWKDRRSALVIVKPDTVIRWQKKRFRDPDPELAAPKPTKGRLVARPVLNGLHHDYRPAA